MVLFQVKKKSPVDYFMFTFSENSWLNHLENATIHPSAELATLTTSNTLGPWLSFLKIMKVHLLFMAFTSPFCN